MPPWLLTTKLCLILAISQQLTSLGVECCSSLTTELSNTFSCVEVQILQLLCLVIHLLLNLSCLYFLPAEVL